MPNSTNGQFSSWKRAFLGALIGGIIVSLARYQFLISDTFSCGMNEVFRVYGICIHQTWLIISNMNFANLGILYGDIGYILSLNLGIIGGAIGSILLGKIFPKRNLILASMIGGLIGGLLLDFLLIVLMGFALG